MYTRQPQYRFAEMYPFSGTYGGIAEDGEGDFEEFRVAAQGEEVESEAHEDAQVLLRERLACQERRVVR
jgi:hypothetical protein